jgi:nitroreductase
MVRAYEPDPVSREVIERVVGTIRRAPSAGFSQGQRVLVVTDPEQRRRIADAVGEEYYVEIGYDRWLSVAPVILIVCTREQDYHDRYVQPDKTTTTGGEEIEWPVPFWWVDAGAYVMLIQLAAIDEGLATGVFGVDARLMDGLRDVLGLPNDIRIVCCLTLGRAAEEAPDRSSRATWPRKPLDELVRWERWS